MAEKRKNLSKRIRFEVFKRDKFTCQYCGKSAPDVVLEVDHIKPVSKGGTNEMINLVTSCFDCNRGKSDKELSDDAVVKKQQEQMLELAEKKEQLDMLYEWRKELLDIKNNQVDMVCNYFEEVSSSWFSINEYGKKKVKKWLQEFSVEELFDAIEISVNKYLEDKTSQENVLFCFDKIPGICANKRRNKTDRTVYYANYIIKTLKNNGFYCNEKTVRSFVRANVKTEEAFNNFVKEIHNSRHWSELRQRTGM